MDIAVVGFLTTMFLGFTLLNNILGGQLLTSTTTSIINDIIVFRPVTILGLWSIPVPNINFFTVGIPHLVRWDYSFFGGNAAVLQYFFYAITAAVAFGLFVTVIGVISQYFTK